MYNWGGYKVRGKLFGNPYESFLRNSPYGDNYGGLIFPYPLPPNDPPQLTYSTTLEYFGGTETVSSSNSFDDYLDLPPPFNPTGAAAYHIGGGSEKHIYMTGIGVMSSDGDFAQSPGVEHRIIGFV